MSTRCSREAASQSRHCAEWCAPEPGHGMKEAMGRVLGEIGDDEDLGELKEHGLAGDGGLQGRTDGPAKEHGGRHEGEKHGRLDEKVTDHEMGEVRGPSLAEDPLGGQPREEMLEGHEDGGEDEEIQEKPVEAEMI